MEDYDKWGTCPSEILALIFKYIHGKDLLSCTGVNTRWRDNANYSGEKYKKWEKLVEKLENKGNNSLQRTKLGFKDLYLNCRMWNSVKKAQVTLKHVYGLKEVISISVYKDTLIVTCLSNILFYNLERNTVLKVLFEATWSHYVETDYLVAKINKKEFIHIELYSKRHNKEVMILGRGPYSIQNNKCYFIGLRHSIQLYESKPENLVLFQLGRHYSSPQLLKDLYMYENDMFIFTTKGEVFNRKSGQLNVDRICTLRVPSPPGSSATFIAMFHKCSAIYAVKSKEKEVITSSYDQEDYEHLVLLCCGVTCAVQHDAVLLLGYQDGKVGVIIIKDLWVHYNLKPVFEFYIHEVAGVRKVEPVVGLEAYEGDGCHHVIVQTTSNLYQVVISHPDYNKVML